MLWESNKMEQHYDAYRAVYRNNRTSVGKHLSFVAQATVSIKPPQHQSVLGSDPSATASQHYRSRSRRSRRSLEKQGGDRRAMSRNQCREIHLK
jgi:hypothetical protein